MLTRKENELVTRTGPGTPLGEVMRRYWIPIALARELPEPDCPPIRVRVLGEDLLAFRDTKGRIGLIDEFCAHRRTSLFLGRNEEGGLRCVYHGWKYDVYGHCVDMPSEPTHSNFKEKIGLTAYPTIELGDIVWAYMGPDGEKPLLPKFEWTQVPSGYRYVSKNWEECNWLQALEGGIDSIHATFLHRALTRNTSRWGIKPDSFTVRARDQKIDVELTDYGFMYAAIGSIEEGKIHARTVHYVMPFHQVRSHRAGGRLFMRGHMWVPMDDENCMVYHWMCSIDGTGLGKEGEEMEESSGRGPGELKADFRKVRNKENNWLLDRAVQRTETFSGIEGTNTQDEAVQESMGRIVDRTKEHLGTSDKAVIAARRLLLETIKIVQEGGNPPGLSPSYYFIRGVDKVLPNETNWREALKDEMRTLGKGV